MNWAVAPRPNAAVYGSACVDVRGGLGQLAFAFGFGGIRHGNPDELIAATSNRTNVALRCAIVAECTANGLDPACQGRLADEPAAPDRIEEFMFGDNAPVVTHQHGQNVKHLRLHLDRNSIATQFVSRKIG